MSLTEYTNLVSWEPRNRKEVDEAKSIYITARSQNRRIVDSEGKAVELFDPELGEIQILETELKENEIAARIIDETGDRRLIWDSRDPAQIQECESEFNKYLAKGWKAYAIDRNGKKGRRVYAFDFAKEEIYFDDKKTIKERLSTFVKEFGGNFQVLPKTTPG
jgi:hypothetical protein